MKNSIFIFFFLLFITQLGQAQNRSCNSYEYHQQQLLDDPSRAAKMAEIEKATTKYIQRLSNAENVNGLITIPVVVHVVYGNNAQNVSEAQIQSQIDVLNEDFRRLNSDANNTWSQAADSEIEFCLATIDPNGNATNGITRTATTSNPFTDTNDPVKKANRGGIPPWNRDDYLNFWVCELDGFLGYAQFPGGPAATDGVVCDYRYFGTMGTAEAPFNLGRTGTHEVGHYLNLSHIWGDGGCGVDDNVNDTPASDDANYGCTSNHSSCGSTDMVQNYMDYSDDACMNLFTTGQKNRMRALFEANADRVSLLSSTACGAVNPPTTCDAPTNINSNSINATGATVSWSAATGAQTYDLRYRIVGAASWSGQNSISGTSFTFTGLSNCSTYEYRVRTDCGTENSGFSSISTFVTTGCNQPTTCDTPTNINANNINATGATVSWSATTGAQTYDLRYRIVGAASWSGQNNISGTSFTFTDLSNCSTYQYRVRTDCGTENSGFSSILTFVTTGCNQGTCDTPTNLTTSNITTTGATLNWSNETNADRYLVRYRVVGTTGWAGIVSASSNSISLDDLDFCADYQWRVRSICEGPNSSFSTISTFTTGCNNGSGSGDAGIISITNPTGVLCSNNISPIVRLKNYDDAPLTSVTITYDIDGGASENFQWTGTIAAGAIEEINLPNLSTSFGLHEFNAVTSLPNGGADANTSNDASISDFETTGQAKIQIRPDEYGSDITWELKDDNDNIIAEGGPYADNDRAVKLTRVCLDNGCYTFNIYDSYGDGICCNYGSGWYRIRTVDNQNIIQGDGQYGSFETQTFCIGGGNNRGQIIASDEQRTPAMKVYPNPAEGEVFVDLENVKENSRLTIYNGMGKVVEVMSLNQEMMTKRIDLSNFSDGLYFIKLDDGKKVMSQKLIVTNARR